MPTPKTVDDSRLSRTLTLAARGRYSVSPNPMVGAVVVGADGRVLAEGWHRRAGTAHAEADALSRLLPGQSRGATVYVNLEPCSHHGRTPPCSDALIDAEVARVVAIHGDPDARVAGEGFAKLREAGVRVEVCSSASLPPGLSPEAARRLVERAVAVNFAYLTSSRHARPAVTLKWAMSLDGRVATRTGESQWISSPSARRWALDLREQHDAIMVGSGTALADDPRLNRRLGKAPSANLRVVVDRRLRLEPAAAMFTIEGPILVVTESQSPLDRRHALAGGGAEVVVLPVVDAASVLALLHERGVLSVLVEGGPGLAAVFAESGLYERVALCCAPLLIGGAGHHDGDESGSSAVGPLGGRGFSTLQQAERLERLEVTRRGPDLLISAFRKGCLPDLCSSVAAS